MLNTGPDDHRNPTEMAEFEDVLRDCARHHLPMICANPDLQVIRGGVRVLCAGSLALRYQELGGDVRSLGKPDPAIYQPVLQSLGLPVGRVLAVGDALHTDIAGAAGCRHRGLLGAGRHSRRSAGGRIGKLRPCQSGGFGDRGRRRADCDHSALCVVSDQRGAVKR